MTEEYFQSEDFYKLCLRACNFQFSKYYKPYFKEKEDMISNAILSIFEHKKELENLEENELFIKVSKIAKVSFEKDRTKMLKEIYNTAFSLDEEIFTGKTYGEILTVVCDKFLEEKEDLKTLKSLFIDFAKRFNKANMEIVLDYLKGMSLNKIQAKHKKNPQSVVQIVREFRVGFADFLEGASYINKADTLKKSANAQERSNKRRRCEQRKRGLEVDYRLYKSDCLAYRLLRERNIFDEVSQCLDKTSADLQDIVFHNRPHAKLFLFEIQKLREEFFKEYTLTELANP